MYARSQVLSPLPHCSPNKACPVGSISWGAAHVQTMDIRNSKHIFPGMYIHGRRLYIYSCSFSHTHLVTLKPLLGHEFYLLLCHQLFLSSKVRITIVIPLITAIIVSSCCIAGNRWALQHTVVSIWRLNTQYKSQ